MIGVEASCPIMSEKEESEALNNVMMRAFVKMPPLVMCAPLYCLSFCFVPQFSVARNSKAHNQPFSLGENSLPLSKNEIVNCATCTVSAVIG